MNAARSNNLSLKYHHKVERYRDKKIRVCGKDSILFGIFKEKFSKNMDLENMKSKQDKKNDFMS